MYGAWRNAPVDPTKCGLRGGVEEWWSVAVRGGSERGNRGHYDNMIVMIERRPP